MYSLEDYNCPECGWELDYDDPKLRKSTYNEYAYVCPECGTEFETPDV
jgi:predicted RNA-binding Zn-ribbon protein involved in translation (DUF1610 family)